MALHLNSFLGGHSQFFPRDWLCTLILFWHQICPINGNETLGVHMSMCALCAYGANINGGF